MSSVAPDPLDRIQTRASRASSELYEDVLALVQVARAARAVADGSAQDFDALRAALARLDKDTTT